MIVELDRLGNATLNNNEVNVKTFTETSIITNDYVFDIANEVLIYGENKIDLKKIIGSTNEYESKDILIDENTDEGKRSVMSNACIFSLISMCIWCLALLVILSIFNYQYTIPFILYNVSCIFIVLSNSITRGTGNLKLYSISNFILSAITLILNVVFIAVIKLGVNGLLYSTVVANTVTSIFLFIKQKLYKYINFKYVTKAKLKEMITYSYPLVPNNIGWSIINISDRIFITGFLGSSANGIYAMANKFPNIMNTFSTFFFTAFKENASKAVKNEDYVEYYNNIQEIVHNAFIAISLMLITVMPFIFNIFINKAYSDSYNYIPILVIALYYGNMSGFYGSLFVAFKETKLIGKSTVVGAIINIAINLLLIKISSIYIAVISTLLSNYIVNLYRKKKIDKYIKLSSIKNYYISIGILVAATILFYFKSTIINILSLILCIIYCFIINKGLIKDILSILKAKISN